MGLSICLPVPSSRLEVWAGLGAEGRDQQMALGHWLLAPRPPTLASGPSLMKHFGPLGTKRMEGGQE